MSYITDKILDLLVQKGILVLEDKQYKKEIKERIDTLLSKYETEVFYNSLIKYFQTSNKIEQIVDRMTYKEVGSFTDKDELAKSIFEAFIAINQGASAGQYSQLKSLIKAIIDAVDYVLNKPRTLEERRLQNKDNEILASQRKIINNQMLIAGELEINRERQINQENVNTEILEQLKEIKKMQIANVATAYKDILSSTLSKQAVPYTSRKETTIDSSKGQITVEILVKKSQFLDKFKSIEELCKHVNFTMQEVTLEAVSAKFFVNGEKTEHLYVDSIYNGDTLALSFRSFGDVSVIDVDNFLEGRRTGEVKSSVFTIAPVIPEPILILDLYDSDMDIMLSNIELRVSSRYFVSKETIRIVISNTLQKDSAIDVIIEMDIHNTDLIQSSFTIDRRVINSVSKMVEWLKIRKKSSLGNITAKLHGTNKTFFECSSPLDYQENKQLELEFDLFKKLNYIEKKMQIKFGSIDLTNEDVSNVCDVYELLRTGKCIFTGFSGSIPLAESNMFSEVKKGQILWVTFTTKDTFIILDQVIDIGLQRVIMTKVSVEDFDDTTIKIKSCNDSVNLRVAYKYYKYKDIEDILKAEDISEISPMDLAMIN